jgi:hypothetical protein
MKANEQKDFIIKNFGQMSIYDITRRTGCTADYVWRTAHEYYITRRDEFRTRENAQIDSVDGKISPKSETKNSQDRTPAQHLKRYAPYYYVIHLWNGCERSFVIKTDRDYEPDQLYYHNKELIDVRISRISMWEIEQMELGVYSLMNSVNIKRDLQNLTQRIFDEIR